jgi:hypothetical protein
MNEKILIAFQIQSAFLPAAHPSESHLCNRVRTQLQLPKKKFVVFQVVSLL